MSMFVFITKATFFNGGIWDVFGSFFFLLYSLYSCLKKLVLYNLDLVPLLFRC